MGEITAMRQRVFSTAFRNICRAAQQHTKLPLQLGVDREFLQKEALEVYKEQSEFWLEKAARRDSTLKDFEELSKAAHHLVDVYDTVSAAAKEKGDSTGLVHRLRRETAELRSEIFDLINDRIRSIEKELQVKLATAEAVFDILDRLLKAVAPAHRHVPWHMTALMRVNLG
eukprot:gene7178-9191_t